MQLWLWVAWTLVTVLASQNDSIQNIPGYWQVCANVYSRSDWNGFIDPHVEIDPSFHGEWDPVPFSQFAVVVYAYEDRDKLGVIDPEGHKEYVCRNSSIAKGICSEESYGRVLLDSAQSTRYPIISELVEFSDRQQLIKYNVSDSSSYCVATVPVQSCQHATGLHCWISGYKEDKCYLRKDSKCDKIVPAEEDNVTEKLRARVRFRNPFGYLQASKASLPMFYFISSGIYFALLILWLCKCCINRRYLLRIQHYMTVLGVLTACDQLITGFYYLSACQRGKKLGFLWAVATLGAIRIVYTLLFLLLLCLGYSVVWETLSLKSLLYWVPLGAGTLATLLFYFVDANYNSGDGTEVELFGVIVIPILAVLLLFNFLWIYLCLNATQAHLYEHRETYKVGIYKQLRKVVLVCALTVPLFTFYRNM